MNEGKKEHPRIDSVFSISGNHGHVNQVFEDKVSVCKARTTSNIDAGHDRNKASSTSLPQRPHPRLRIAKDKGWAWLVCFASFMHFMIFPPIFFLFGLIFVELVDEFETSKRDTAWIMSINIALSMISGPPASMLCIRFGYWVITIVGSLITFGGMIASSFAQKIQTLYITYGFVTGIGYGFVYHASVVCVILSFDKRKAFATGLSNIGFGIGLFIASPILQACIQAYGWRRAVLLDAGLFLNGIAIGLVYRPVRAQQNGDNCQVETGGERDAISQTGAAVNGSLQKSSPKYSKKTDDSAKSLRTSVGQLFNQIKTTLRNSSEMELLKSLKFELFMISSTLMYMTIFTPFFFVPDLAKSKGVGGGEAAWLLSAAGIAGTASRFVFGWLSDRPWADMFIVQSTAIIVCGLSTCLMPLCDVYGWLLADVIVFSAFEGYVPPLVSVLSSEITGPAKVSEGYGLLCCFSGLSNLLGPPIAGWLFDYFGNYHVSFWSFGLVLITSGCILFAARSLHHRDMKVNHEEK